MRGVALLLLLSLLGTPGRGSVLEGAEGLELLPGERWLRPRSGLELGLARPAALPDLALGWVGVALGGALHPRFRWTQLHAGPYREDQLAAGLRIEAGGMAVGLGLEELQQRISGLLSRRHRRVWGHGGILLGALELAAQWEGPLRAHPDRAAGRSQLLLRWRGPDWELGLSRLGSRYGGIPRWEGGLRLGSALAPLRAGVTLADAGLALRLAARRGSWRLGFGLPLAGVEVGAVAVSVGWEP